MATMQTVTDVIKAATGYTPQRVRPTATATVYQYTPAVRVHVLRGIPAAQVCHVYRGTEVQGPLRRKLAYLIADFKDAIRETET